MPPRAEAAQQGWWPRGPGKALAVLRTQLAHGLAYPADLLLRSLGILIFLWVFIHLWRSSFAASGQTRIQGLSLSDTLWYLVLAESITLAKPRVATEIARAIKDGTIAYQLGRPMNWLLYQASLTLGEAIARGLATLLLGGLLVAALVGPPPPPATWPLAALAVLAAWLLDFCMAALIGLLAFVVEDVAAFEWIYSKLVLVLGGVLLPLDFLPDGWRQVAQALPFAATTWAPARLFVSGDAGLFARLFGLQLAWLLVVGLGLHLAFSRAARHLAVNGG